MKRKWLISLLLISFVSSHAYSQGKLKRQTVGDGITMKVSSLFIPMSESDMWQRMTSYRKSIALFTDMNRVVELGVNRSYSVWQKGDYDMMLEVYKSSILQLYDEVEFIKEEVTVIKKQPFVVFEFVSRMYPDESLGSGAINKYTYIQYTVHDQQTLVFNFNCPLFKKDIWQPVANQMMRSVVLK